MFVSPEITIRWKKFGAINLESKPNTECSKYSADNLKANYLVNFKGNLSREYLSTGNFDAVNHETRFFREPHTDEIVHLETRIIPNKKAPEGANFENGAHDGVVLEPLTKLLQNVKTQQYQQIETNLNRLFA